jgi:hypothetical protein
LATTFWASTQVGSSSRLARICSGVIAGYGPGGWPRWCRQLGHISTSNSPSTRVNGPVVLPQNPQPLPIAALPRYERLFVWDCQFEACL